MKPSSLLHRGEALFLPFVPDEHDDHVAVAVLPGVLQPGGQVVEGVPPGDVVHQQGPGSSTVVRSGDGSEGFLSSLNDCRLTAGLETYVGFSTHSVPYLEFDLFTLDIDHPGPELHTDCEIVDRLKPLVCKLEQETGFSNSYHE